ncbi:hypothetical protein BSIN_3251 [Burkholderia singularis]|uniref:Uncharacterized protein n=1 Tax=Burkholderia singularis TaxID=1503053 RepID=A0A238H445_9BURK|nr:hypothetical protein BSIN_3251 [Burkholderia singularis]
MREFYRRATDRQKSKSGIDMNALNKARATRDLEDRRELATRHAGSNFRTASRNGLLHRSIRSINIPTYSCFKLIHVQLHQSMVFLRTLNR